MQTTNIDEQIRLLTNFHVRNAAGQNVLTARPFEAVLYAGLSAGLSAHESSVQDVPNVLPLSHIINNKVFDFEAVTKQQKDARNSSKSTLSSIGQLDLDIFRRNNVNVNETSNQNLLQFNQPPSSFQPNEPSAVLNSSSMSSSERPPQPRHVSNQSSIIRAPPTNFSNSSSSSSLSSSNIIHTNTHPAAIIEIPDSAFDEIYDSAFDDIPDSAFLNFDLDAIEAASSSGPSGY